MFVRFCIVLWSVGKKGGVMVFMCLGWFSCSCVMLFELVVSLK